MSGKIGAFLDPVRTVLTGNGSLSDVAKVHLDPLGMTSKLQKTMSSDAAPNAAADADGRRKRSQKFASPSTVLTQSETLGN